ncbi:MAG TPA: hypothetical protein VM101_01260 [Flavitalea sp.]|nr:hypothetical protein [Flavitalea sp.]
MDNTTSPHILGTSANLLGFCLIVITSLHIAQKTESTRMDELTSIVALLLTFSSILSFISIRTENVRKEKRLEMLADLMFFTALAGIAAIIIFIAFTFWK